MVKTNDLYYIDNGWKPGIIGNKYYWLRRPTAEDAKVGRFRNIKTNKVYNTVPENHWIVGPLISADLSMKLSGEQRTPEKYEKFQKLLGEEPDYQGPTLDEVVVTGTYTGKKNNIPFINSSEVSTWGDLDAYKQQLEAHNDKLESEWTENYSREHDERYRLKGWECRLVDGVDDFGRKRKEYRFVNPKTGEVGPLVSRWWLEDRGLDKSAGAFGRYSSYEDLLLLNSFRKLDNEMIKRATRNIEGHSSLDYFTGVTGGAFNFMNIPNLVGGTIKAIRNGESPIGAIQNIGFGYDYINPELSGNNGIFEITSDLSKWADEHPYWAGAANMATEAVAGGAIMKGFGVPGNVGSVRNFFKPGKFRISAGKAINNSLRRVNYGASRAERAATNITNNYGRRLLNTRVGNTSVGRKLLSRFSEAPKSAAPNPNEGGFLSRVGNKTIQLIPLKTRTWLSNAWDDVTDFTSKFKPSNLASKGLEAVTDQSLSPTAQKGFNTLVTAYGLGKAGYDALSGNDTDITAFGAGLKYIPGVSILNTPYIWYKRGKAGYDTYNNVMDIYNNGITPENIYETGKSASDVFGNG